MSRTFVCCHCQKRFTLNPRLKVCQRYCSSKVCQQARKNAWERNKLHSDPEYRFSRQASKRLWYKNRPGHCYQREYRESHPDYVLDNRTKQQKHNKSRTEPIPAHQIVKTDALLSELFAGSDFHVILPVENESVLKDCKDGRVNRVRDGLSMLCGDITKRIALIVKTDAIASLIRYG